MVVIDASVANKLLLSHEEHHERAKSIFKKHIQDVEEIVIPDLLFYEVANTLATKTAIPQDQVIKSLIRLNKLNLNTYHLSIEQICKAAKMAEENNVSVYDASYAVLAEEKKCDLITADTKFADQVNLPFVKKLSKYS